MLDRARGTYSVQSVLKAFDLLELLAAEDSNATIPVLAKRLDVSRNKVFRLLATLEDTGFIERDAAGVYRLGLHAFEMAQHILKSASLIRLSHPVMEKLARKHDEAVYITVMNNDEVLFLDMVDSFQQIKAADMVGQRFPFFTNAAGKAIKAMSSPDMINRLGRRRGTRGGNIPDVQQLEHELREIRKKGVAIDFGGLGDDICAVAVAIRDYAGKVVGALTMLAPSFRMFQERLEHEIIPSMLEGAEVLSMKFGYAKIPA
jgi:DNA-binding IclR family transcriptional regulator